MPDAIFADPRLAEIYDLVDGPRDDLDAYVAIAGAERARTVLDLGCGTGSLAVRLAAEGYEVTGFDPAEASLAVARGKRHADKVRWMRGSAATAAEHPALAPCWFDLVTMTGNVAQVVLDDSEWSDVLASANGLLRPNGLLVFETRRPEAEAWRAWTRDHTYRRLSTPGRGGGESYVVAWTDLLDVSLPLVSFRQNFLFETRSKNDDWASGGTTVGTTTGSTIGEDESQLLTSDSTLRFRTEPEIRASLDAAGFSVEDMRDAPDRPGMEMVFLARAPVPST